MPSINLAPGTQYVITARKRKVRLYAIAIGIIAIFFLGWIALYTYVQILNSSSTNVKTEIQSVNQKIQSLRDQADRVAFFEKRLVDVSNLLDSHIGWEKIFADIERLLPVDTVITGIDATTEDSFINIQGTTQNIDQIAVALASLTKDVNHPSVFESGTVKTIQREDKEGIVVYKFTMTLEFTHAALSKAAL